ncbi:MAG: ribonuclease R [Patescibacteria group bacterium]
MSHSKHPQKHKSKETTASTTIESTISTTAKGLGFIKHPTLEEDIRVEARSLNTALHGDLVKVVLHSAERGMQPTGEVVEVIKRAKTHFVGVAEKQNGFFFVVPDDRRMYTDLLIQDPPADLKENDKVLVLMHEWKDPAKDPLCSVKEIIGPKGSHEAEIRSIILANNIDDTFPANVATLAKTIQANSEIKEENLRDRTDFRKTLTFTIDPVDAKDFDDALSFKKLENDTYEIGVHIADVSHYVLPGSVLDAEARHRAFSVYLVDRTIPMLPEELSNDVCSLKPDVPRLTFSIWWTLNTKGEILVEKIGKTIIHSQKRFSYEEAQESLDTPNGHLHEELTVLNTIAETLRDKRMKAGAIDFEQHEVRFELADDGVPLSAYTKERLATHKLIEEFMLLANKRVAEHVAEKYKKEKHPFVYRVHDLPNREKLDMLTTFVHALGHTLSLPKNALATGTQIASLFEEVAGTPEENLIKTAALRSMAKAAYDTRNIGHFGLALPAYAHFTSPIRRYADLLVHRYLHELLTKGALPLDEWATVDRIAGEISGRELTVITAERDSVKYKQVEYMTTHIGETFDAIISGVSEWGIFVEERETRAEGLVRLATLGDDYYELEPKKYRIVGKRKKKIYALGDRVKVRLVAANLDKKVLDYAIVP